MKLETIKELMDVLNEKRSGTRAPGQRPKGRDKKIKGDLRDKKRRLRDEEDDGDDGK